MKTEAVRIRSTGGPEVLRWEEVDLPEPGPGFVRLRHTAIGLNYVDVYQRAGSYQLPLPFTPGNEGAGIVEAVGDGVSLVSPGDRVAYAMLPGAYAVHRLAPADRLVKLPAEVDDRTAAAIMLKGMTAQYLLRRTFPVKAGDWVLFHAAVGGVGLLACQWAAALGATVVGTVGGEGKMALAAANGCRHVIDYNREDFAARVRDLTPIGVDVAYDSVGRDTFERTLDTLRIRGMLVSFGQSSGPVAPFTTAVLNQKGSLYVTRPTLAHYIGTRDELELTAADLFAVVGNGTVKVGVNQTFALRDAAEAHRALEARRTIGSTVLMP